MTIYLVNRAFLSPLCSPEYNSLHWPYLKSASQLSVPPKPLESRVPSSIPPQVRQRAGWQPAKPWAIPPSSICSPPAPGVNVLSPVPCTYTWCTLLCAVYTSCGCMGRQKNHVPTSCCSATQKTHQCPRRVSSREESQELQNLGCHCNPHSTDFTGKNPSLCNHPAPWTCLRLIMFVVGLFIAKNQWWAPHNHLLASESSHNFQTLLNTKNPNKCKLGGALWTQLISPFFSPVALLIQEWSGGNTLSSKNILFLWCMLVHCNEYVFSEGTVVFFPPLLSL